MAKKEQAGGELAASIREDACRLFIIFPSDERHGASTSVWMYCERLGYPHLRHGRKHDRQYLRLADHYTVEQAFRGCTEV